jgi:hypothetical protein
MARNTLIQIRRGTSEQWSAANNNLGTLLSSGEWGYDTTLGRYKIGDGSTPWNDLPWASIRPLSQDITANSGIAVSFNPTASGVDALLNISVSGIQSSQVNDFSTAVSGLLPGITGISGINVNYSSANNRYTISLTDPEINIGDIVGFVDAVNDRVGSLLTAGSNIQLTYNDNNSNPENSSLTIAVTGVSLEGHTHLSTDITDFTEAVQDVVGSGAGSGGFLVNGTGLAWNYDDNANSLRVDITGIPSVLINDIDAFISGSIDTSLVAGTGIGFEFNSVDNALEISVTGISNTLVQGLGTMSVQDADNVNITNGSINVSGLTVNNTGVSLSGHTHVWSDITDASLKASLTELAYLSGVVPGTASANRAVVLDNNGDISGIRAISTTGTLTVGGDLVVHGTTTTVNSTEVNIGDNIITVNTSGLSEGGFRVFKGGDPAVSGNYKSLLWNNTNNRWEFSGPQIHTSGLIKANTFESTVASPTAPMVVASTGLVTNLNADLLDGQDGSYYLDYTKFTNTPTIGSGILTLNVAGVGLSGTASFDANSTSNVTFTVTSNATSSSTNGTVVSRDSSGNFAANQITASQFIGGGSGLINLNASNISSGTLDSARLPPITATTGTVGPTGTFVSSLTVDAYGRVTALNRTTHTLATTSVQGIASFDSNDFAVNSGVVSVKASGISNNQLVNSSVTFGVTSVNLGGSSNRIDHLVAISGESTTTPTVLTFCKIDGGSP